MLGLVQRETRSHFSAGSGVSINEGKIAIGQSVGVTDSVSFDEVNANVRGNVIGNLSGNVSGSLSGDVTGNVTGDVDRCVWKCNWRG